MNISHIIKNFAKNNKFSIAPILVKGFDTSYKVQNDNLLSILKFVKESQDLKFTILTDLFAADFPSRKKRFEVAYNLLSLKLNKRILFKVNLEENENAKSATSVYSASCWYEREVFDMFGIKFDNSPDTRRILTDYGFKGHPLRKEFPLTGHLQVKYDYELERIIYEPVLLEQEFRNFDFTSPWKGPQEHKLPGDEKAMK